MATIYGHCLRHIVTQAYLNLGERVQGESLQSKMLLRFNVLTSELNA